MSFLKSLHFTFFLVEFSFLFSCGVLVLLILGDEIVHVWFGFGELHFVHSLTSIPMKKSLSLEHGGELLSNTFVHFLDSGWVSEEGYTHLESLRWDITDGTLDVVGNPLNKIWGVFVLYVKHLLIDFLGAHSASEEWAGSQVSSVSWVRCAHHVLGIEHLLSKLWNGESSVLLRSTWCEWGKANHEEVETWKWYQVDSEFS